MRFESARSFSNFFGGKIKKLTWVTYTGVNLGIQTILQEIFNKQEKLILCKAHSTKDA